MSLDIVGRDSYIVLVDRDEFSRATRLGRVVAQNLAAALAGGAWYAFPADQFLERVFARPVPTLEPILSVIRDLESPSLFDPTERALEEIDRIVAASAQSTPDLVLKREAQRQVLSGSPPSEERLVRDLCMSELLRHAVDGRGGLRDTCGAGYVHERLRTIRNYLEPSASRAAARLLRSPARSLLGLTTERRISPTTDLLDAGSP